MYAVYVHMYTLCTYHNISLNACRPTCSRTYTYIRTWAYVRMSTEYERRPYN